MARSRKYEYLIELFEGLWSAEDGRVLFITYRTKNLFNVSFAPSQNSGPVLRDSVDGKPSLMMRGIGRDDTGELDVELGREGQEPWLNLLWDNTGFHGKGEYLVPGLVTLDSAISKVKREDVSWIGPLSPFGRVDKHDWDKFTLFRYTKKYHDHQ